MADLITDEMVETAHEAAMEDAALTPAGEFIDVGSVGAMIRAALSEVAPMIRAQVFREAATIADEHRDDCAGKLSRGRRSWSDHDIAVFESAESEANSIAVALLALAQKETAR